MSHAPMATDAPGPQLKCDLDEAIAACAGLWLDATRTARAYARIEDSSYPDGASNRSRYAADVARPGPGSELQPGPHARQLPLSDRPPTKPYSQPYWLAQPKTGKTYTIDRQAMRDLPESPPLLYSEFQIQAGRRDRTAAARCTTVMSTRARRD